MGGWVDRWMGRGKYIFKFWNFFDDSIEKDSQIFVEGNQVFFSAVASLPPSYLLAG